jgi:5-formyltetrahydrofolate cyclo-ligase
MKKESPSSIATQLSKVELRPVLKQKRAALSSHRRYEARQSLVEKLLPLLKTYNSILSFHSLSTEIDLSLMNQALAKEGKLHLPKIDHDELLLYRVQDLETLIPSKLGFYEPDPVCCESIHVDYLDCILVPGLGFDANRHRIGYGKGHYDRLLASLRSTRKIGIGFKEQLWEQGIPFEEHDVRLDEIRLY